jgi:hypothetical protein
MLIPATGGKPGPFISLIVTVPLPTAVTYATWPDALGAPGV